MDAFYAKVINQLLGVGIFGKTMKILIVCGGDTDKEVFYRSGFRDVVVSNLDTRMTGTEFDPFAWSFQDAERLTFADDAFDFCIVHSGLHHCYSPHRALLEMYRVAHKGILLFEPYDNFLTRLGMRVHIGQEYEHAAVFYNDCSYGGVKNSWIPNYVYRWTETEIIKTITAFAPHAHHQFKFIYEMRIPWPQLKGRKKKLAFYAVFLSIPILKMISMMFPRQSNNFAAVILKPKLPHDLHPWLLWEGNQLKLNQPWFADRYGTKTVLDVDNTPGYHSVSAQKWMSRCKRIFQWCHSHNKKSQIVHIHGFVK